MTDADIDEMIETLRKQRADWSPVERKSADGDKVTVDFEGTRQGRADRGRQPARMFPIVLGGGQMLEDFEKNLLGLAAGDEKSFKLKFQERLSGG